MSPIFRTAIFIVFVTHLFSVAAVQAQDAGSRLSEAADAYANSDYQTAIELYEQVLAGGQYAFEVYYNLGNAYFKTNRIGPAILNYERAVRIDPADPDVQYNLAMAQSRTVDKVETLQLPELITGYKSFVNTMPADRWGFLSLLAFVCMLAAVAVFLFTAQRWVKQGSLVLGVVLIALTLVFLLFGWQQQRWLNSNKEAVVFRPSITVTSTPDNAGEELFVLHEGTKVRVVERFREWVRIRIGDGNSGWVPEAAVEEI